MRLRASTYSCTRRHLCWLLAAGCCRWGAAMGDQDDGFAYRTDRPVEELRQELEDLAAGWTLAEGTTFDLVNCGGTPCEWIRATCKAESKLEGAVYFHMHGGGHYRGSSRVAAPVCSHISGLAGIDCLSVGSREVLGPISRTQFYGLFMRMARSTTASRRSINGLSPLMTCTPLILGSQDKRAPRKSSSAATQLAVTWLSRSW
eukprot:COSAG05_NODE_740_length_7614_cov_34.093812_4_plen_203_part_00